MHTYRLLVIEDEEQDYRLLLRHLDTHHVRYEAERAANAQQLADLLGRRETAWNLVLADHSLPDIDIRTTLHWLLSKVPDAPVIMVSGSIGEEKAVDLLQEGVEDFVSKGNLARLVPAMERATDAARIRRARRTAETELEVRNRALEAASNGIVITQAVGDMAIVYVNPAFTRITGYTADEVVGTNCRLLHRDDSNQPALETIRAAIEQRRSCQVVLRNYRKDGTPFWNKMSVAPVLDAYQRLTHFVGILEDITESMRQQQRLRQSATVFDNANEGMTVTDLDGNIIEVNRAFTDITGYARDEVIGKNPRMLQSGRHGRDFFQSMWALLREGGRWSGEIWNRRKSGEVYPELLTISVVRDEHDVPTHYVGVFADISTLKQSEERLEFLAHHDPLTRLPNRLLFNARLHHAVEHAFRNDTPLAVLLLDIDRFKSINDAHGHTVGDELLRQVGERLTHCVRVDDTVARVGGDEFVVLLERMVAAQNAATVAEKIQLGFGEPFEIDGIDHYVTASIGIGTFPGDGDSPAELVRNADSAMYQVKEQGRNGYRFYAPEFTARAVEHAALDSDLHKAVALDQLTLHYQPQVQLDSGRLIGAEALLRWEHPERGRVPPGVFIPIAEDSGQILEIGAWVLETACRQARAWQDAGLTFGRIAVNIAGPQIRKGNLHKVVANVLRETGLAPEFLELEVTEGFIMGHHDRGVADLDALRRLGVRLAIDDFGTGYSSLAYLKRLPIQCLKIDQSFVRALPDDPEDAAISSAVIAMGRSLGLGVLAEGVESEAQRRFLLDQGCERGQGYLFGRPMAAADFEHWAQVGFALAGD